ncbi:hypothetical protein BBP40_003126 [Aspergillus hancockii]|nr:hypothetical protein BBP40_003126 [Aspergillus hancockii]
MSKAYYKSALMIIAAMVPEMVVFMAVAQWRVAGRIHRVWLDTWETDSAQREWLGMSGAFFVTMGGFVVDTSRSTEGGNVPEEHSDLVTTISAHGFIELLQNGTIKKLVQEGHLTLSHFNHFNIEDKGKANNIAKAIVMCQIVWMIVQLIGRISTELPITLLEGHVAIQILYSVTAYIFWWEKPLDVAEPIAIPLEVESLMGHDMNNARARPFDRDQFFTTESAHGSPVHMFFRVAYDLYFYLDHRMQFAAAGINSGLHAVFWTSHFPTPAERLLWRLSAVGMGVFPTISHIIILGNGLERFLLEWLYKTRSYPDSLLLLKSVVGIPRNIWQLHWDSSALRKSQEGLSKLVPIWSRLILVDVVILCAFSYFASIGFLTVEAFISVRSLPIGAYSIPKWYNIFPHL